VNTPENSGNTHIAAVVDRSGSMQSIKDDTMGGFDAFIAEQRTKGDPCTVSLYQFDNQYELVCAGLPIEDVPNLVLEPRGSTALLDAIGLTIMNTRERLSALPKGALPGIVIVLIMTDGYENASKTFDYAQIKAMINEREEADGWTFLFMGADQDAIAAASKMGIARDQALSFAADRAQGAWVAMSSAIGTVRESRKAGHSAAAAKRNAAFTDEQRRDNA
jgi:hypothetical protein